MIRDQTVEQLYAKTRRRLGRGGFVALGPRHARDIKVRPCAALVYKGLEVSGGRARPGVAARRAGVAQVGGGTFHRLAIGLVQRHAPEFFAGGLAGVRQVVPQFVVIDEVAGQLIALIAVPASWKCLLAGFILFRGFDIVKPPPVRLLERLPEGTGIVIDDVGAGLYALAVMQLLLHFGVLAR